MCQAPGVGGCPGSTVPSYAHLFFGEPGGFVESAGFESQGKGRKGSGLRFLGFWNQYICLGVSVQA